MSQLTHPLFGLPGLVSRYGLTAFLETGTYVGASVFAAMKAGCKRAVSCEISPEFVERVRQMADLEGLSSSVSIFCGTSRECLPKMLNEVKGERLLVFLDAHMDPANFGLPRWTDQPERPVPSIPSGVPLREEIDILRAYRDLSHDVIIVDDMHFAVAEYGQECAAARGVKQPFATYAELSGCFPAHDARVIDPSDRVMVLTPRGR